MQPWEALRDSREDAGFLDSLTACPVDLAVWDGVRPGIETVLCGCTPGKMDLLFPPTFSGLRLALTVPALGLPGLRIAFRLESNGNGDALVYVRAALREAA
jgi:hypothetical protein